MDQQTSLQKILSFFLVKIIIGIAVVGGSVAFIEWGGRLILNETTIADAYKNLIIGIADSAVALLAYILLFRWYEKRKIDELRGTSFSKNASTGFLSGLILQSLILAIIYLARLYSVTHINPLSSLLPSFTAALTAGFVAEILIIGIIFRLTEKALGTSTAVIVAMLIFTIAHMNVEGVTVLSVTSTVVQAGFLIPASYIFTRSLWFPIFFHFAWDFAEPGIFGGINPGIKLNESLLVSNIRGPALISGGHFGPASSIQALIICIIAGTIFLWLAARKNNFIKPFSQK